MPAICQLQTKQETINGFDSDGTRFVIADRTNARVLIWNNIPANGDVPADIVLGQTDFNVEVGITVELAQRQ